MGQWGYRKGKWVGGVKGLGVGKRQGRWGQCRWLSERWTRSLLSLMVVVLGRVQGVVGVIVGDGRGGEGGGISARRQW